MDEKLEEIIKKRQEYNIKILDILAEQIENKPDLRFGQLLINTKALNYYVKDPSGFHIFDPFYEEPIDTYNRIIQSKQTNEDENNLNK